MRVDLETQRLADCVGLQTSYRAVDGKIRQADPEVVAAVLRALGAPLEGIRGSGAAHRELRNQCRERWLEPVVVCRADHDAGVAIGAALAAHTEHAWVSVELEDGGVLRSRLADAASSHSSRTAGRADPCLELDLRVLAGGPLPLGRHTLSVERDGHTESALLISSTKCPRPVRGLGVFLPVHALRSDNTDWGVGSYTDLATLGRWAASCGAEFLGMLPLYPVFSEPPADPSPYMPVSRLAYNDLFIDPVVLPEFHACDEARSLYARALGDHTSTLESQSLVDYTETARRKRSVLEPMARYALSGALPDRARALNDFAAQHPELEAYARFRASREAPPDQMDAASGYHLYCQLAAYEQLENARSEIGHYADFPVGSHPLGFDPTWAPGSFVAGVHGGAHLTGSSPADKIGAFARSTRRESGRTSTGSCPPRCRALFDTPTVFASTT